MKLSFGIGIIFVPFGLLIPTQYVLAASYASRLSDIVSGAVSAMHVASESLVAAAPDEAPMPALAVLEEPDNDEVVELADGDASSKRRRNSRKASATAKTSASSLPAVFVPAGKVLRLANSGAKPTGRAVTPDGVRPAGVQVFGASALGLGVRDGDVITRVSGVPVTSAGQIIGLILAARGARQAVIVGEVYRGQRQYTLTVEQPYVEGADPPREAPKPAPK